MKNSTISQNENKKLQNELTVYEISQKKGEEERMIHVKELDSKETEIQRKQTHANKSSAFIFLVEPATNTCK